MSNKKQTAVEWLVEQLDNNLDINHSWRTKQDIEQAKEMEKEQIIDCFMDASQNFSEGEANKYYKKTYEQ